MGSVLLNVGRAAAALVFGHLEGFAHAEHIAIGANVEQHVATGQDDGVVVEHGRE